MTEPTNPRVTALSAVTLIVADMAASTAFYETLGFQPIFGGPNAAFTSYRAGSGYLNLMLSRGQHNPAAAANWGRAIFYVDDVDHFHARAAANGLQPQFPPRDAPWRERYFHIRDPDGHEISFAKPIDPNPKPQP